MIVAILHSKKQQFINKRKLYHVNKFENSKILSKF